MTISLGYCHCGCGKKTNISQRTHIKKGYKTGQPFRYIRGHHRRKSLAEYVIDFNGCWVWQRATNGSGYGVMKVKGKRKYAHRHYYEQIIGPIPDGLEIDHLCNNPSCVNPVHLEPKTHSENISRWEHKKLTTEEAKGVRCLRRLGLSQRSIGKLFGISHPTVANIEHGKYFREEGLA